MTKFFLFQKITKFHNSYLKGFQMHFSNLTKNALKLFSLYIFSDISYITYLTSVIGGP